MTAHKLIKQMHASVKFTKKRTSLLIHVLHCIETCCTPSHAFKQLYRFTNFISMHMAMDSVQLEIFNTHNPTSNQQQQKEEKHIFLGGFHLFSLSWILCRLHSAEKCLFYFRSQLLCRLGVREWCSAEKSMRRALNCGHGSLGKQQGCRWRFQVWSKFSWWSCCRPMKTRVLCFFNVHFCPCVPMNHCVDLHSSVLILGI